MAETGGKKKCSKRSRLSVEGEVRLKDFANAKLNSTSVTRLSKSSGTVAVKTVSREEKNWWECELDDFLADLDDDNVNSENDTSDEYVCTIAPKKQLEKEPVGVEYPSDLWYLIGAYVYPESVGKFASLCRASARVLQSPGFWRRLHSRFFDNIADLDESYRPEAMHRMYSLRTYVIRALHHFYPTFLERRQAQLALTLSPETSNVMKLCRSQCAAVWHELIEGPGGKRTFEFYFKFTGATGFNPMEMKILNSRSEDSPMFSHTNHSWMSANPRLGLLRNLWANTEAGCCLLKVVSTQYTCVPPSIIGWRLSEISLGLGQDMCKHRVKLYFPNSTYQTAEMKGKKKPKGPTTVVVIDGAISLSVSDWWHPQYVTHSQ